MSIRLRLNMISETTFTVRGHGVHTAFLEMTNALKKRNDVDIKVNSWRPADVLHIQTVGLYSLLAMLTNRGRRVISVHVIPDSFTGSLIGARYWYKLSIHYLRFFYNRADRLLAVSQETADCLHNQLKVRPPVEVVFNTVEAAEYRRQPTDRAKARTKLKVPVDKFMVVASGQVQPRKRIDVLISLARKFPDAYFVWVGGIPFKRLGADFKNMQSLMASAPQNLTFTGVIELADVKAYYQAADAFILPSDQENHPLAVLEAAASGLPVILRDIPQYASSFADLALMGDDHSFPSIIKKLMSDKKFYASAVKQAGKIAERFDSAAGGEKLVHIYREVLSSKS